MGSDPCFRRLKRAELPVDTASLACFLIGKTLVRDAPAGRTSGRIVETEAYVPGDASGHAYVGETDRNRSLFLSKNPSSSGRFSRTIARLRSNTRLRARSAISARISLGAELQMVV